MKKIELLCPVGNMEMLYSAIHNGADAVYLAGKNYGARKFSNNFTNEELINAIKYSHLYGVLVYITVNTLVYESEIEEFLDYVKFLYLNGADALIMQDIGMIKLVKSIIPDIVIHASTQAHNFNKEGIKLLKELGVQRIVLARELSLKEINDININIEKEIFVYGALCVCYSGQCLFSSLNGGRSGNRGECVGSCRLPYKLIKDNQYIETSGKYLLSMRDLNTLDNLKEILESNIDSIKIEGRMKSPQYVAYITKIYRTLIDKYYSNQEMSLSQEELTNLKKIFNRKFTKGFLFNDNKVANIDSPNHQGIILGKVIKIDKKYIYIKLNTDINMEDGIRFKKSDKGFIANKLYNKNKLLVKSLKKNDICLLENKVKTQINDIVLKTTDSKLMKELNNYKQKKIKIDYKITIKKGEKFKLEISDGINKVEEYGELVKSALTKEVTEENIIKSLSKLGNTPFIANKIDIQKDKNIFISLKSLNETRRKVIEKLINIRSNKKRNTTFNNFIRNKKSNNNNNSTKYKLNILVRTEEQLKCAISNQVDNIYITDYNLYIKYNNIPNIYYRIPRITKEYKDLNNHKLLVPDISSINKYKNNNTLVGDYYLNITNSQTIELLNKQNVNKVTLSPELPDSEIKNIMKRTERDIEIIIYGRLELMIMKYCPIKESLNYCNKCQNNKNKFYLEDRYKNKYPLINNNCLTSIMHHENIDKIDKINEYKKIKITNYRIELFDEDYNLTEKCINKIKKML